jgi:GntR family transcriptional repressor for pyruvate dehydrogenase complex
MSMAQENDASKPAAPASEPLAALLRSHPQTTFDYLEFRSIVAAAAARLAAERATPEDCAKLRAAYDALVEAHNQKDHVAESAADSGFHMATYAAAHNKVMEHIMGRIFCMLRDDVFYDRHEFYTHQGVRELLLLQHKAILDAILAHDPIAAGRAATRHISYVREAVQETRMASQRHAVSLRRSGRDSLAQLSDRTA